MKRYLLSLAVGAVLATSASLAQAQDKGVTIGTLECHEASGAGLIFSSSRNLSCTFSGTEKGAKAARYTGKINRYGVDIGFQENGVILWAVVSTSDKFTPGDLAGKYGGVTAPGSQRAPGRVQQRLRASAAQRTRIQRNQCCCRNRGGRTPRPLVDAETSITRPGPSAQLPPGLFFSVPREFAQREHRIA